jgi:hypothetical protein
MAALALPNQRAARRPQQLPKGAVELGRHSGHGGLGFAQGRDLDEHGSRVDARVIVREEVEGHRRDLGEQLVKGRRVGRGGDVVAVASPDRRLIIPRRGK